MSSQETVPVDVQEMCREELEKLNNKEIVNLLSRPICNNINVLNKDDSYKIITNDGSRYIVVLRSKQIVAVANKKREFINNTKEDRKINELKTFLNDKGNCLWENSNLGDGVYVIELFLNNHKLNLIDLFVEDSEDLRLQFYGQRLKRLNSLDFNCVNNKRLNVISPIPDTFDYNNMKKKAFVRTLQEFEPFITEYHKKSKSIVKNYVLLGEGSYSTEKIISLKHKPFLKLMDVDSHLQSDLLNSAKSFGMEVENISTMTATEKLEYFNKIKNMIRKRRNIAKDKVLQYRKTINIGMVYLIGSNLYKDDRQLKIFCVCKKIQTNNKKNILNHQTTTEPPEYVEWNYESLKNQISDVKFYNTAYRVETKNKTIKNIINKATVKSFFDPNYVEAEAWDYIDQIPQSKGNNENIEFTKLIKCINYINDYNQTYCLTYPNNDIGGTVAKGIEYIQLLLNPSLNENRNLKRKQPGGDNNYESKPKCRK